VELKKGFDQAFESVLGGGASAEKYESENTQREKDWRTADKEQKK
jgi:hypothetical protein